MGAPVRLEAEFFDDPDVDALAELLGYPDRDMAAGKLARLYSWQTEKYTDERPTYAVPRSTLIGIFGARGPEAMVEAGLATLQDDGLYKIAGSDKPNGRTPGKTRVNWLWLERQAQAERGRKRAASAGDGARDQGRFTSAAPAGYQPETSRKHAGDQPPASSPFSVLRSPDPDLSHPAGAREPVQPVDPSEGWERDVPGKPDAPPPARGADSILSLLTEAAAALNAERVRWSPDAPPIDESTAAGVTARLMATPAADRRRKLMHAVACVIARAKRTRSVDGLRWSTFASESAWAYVVDADVDAYAKSDGPTARDGPRRQGPHAPAPPVRTRPLRDL